MHHLTPLPTSWATGTSYDQLPASAPVLDVPTGNAGEFRQAQDWHGRLRLQPVYDLDLQGDSLPPYPPYQHTATVDYAPKVILRAPAGNLAFGTAVSVRRTIFSHSSGGGLYGTQLWGNARSLDAGAVIVPSPEKLTPPPDNTFKTAFVIAAHQRADISDAMIESVDVPRQYWDLAFGAATDGRRQSNSVL